MTTLVFPQDAEDWAQPFNSALAQGVFCDDPTKTTFWALYELLATVTEAGKPTVDVFKQMNTLEFKRVARKETDL